MESWFKDKSVALVGNALSLFDSCYGEEIDLHDVVVRLNRAAMLYTRYNCMASHGMKTNVWMFWWADTYMDKLAIIDSRIKKMHMSLDGRGQNRVAIDYFYPEEYYVELRGKLPARPTIGLMALDYIHRCNANVISVFGFDWKASPTFTDLDRSQEVWTGHNYQAEYNYCKDTFFSCSGIVFRHSKWRGV